MLARFANHPLAPRRAPAPMLGHAVAALLLAGLSAPAAAQNLVQNGRFDVDASVWTTTGSGTALRSPADAHGYGGSGSLELHATAATPSTGFAARQCFSPPAGSYTMRGLTFVPAGQANSGSIGVGFTAWSGSNCDGTQLALGSHTSPSTDAGWLAHAFAANLPAGTNSVRLSLLVTKTQAGGELIGRFDDIFFGKACVASATQLCLDSQRFGVSTTWTTPNSQTGAGVATAFTGEAGYFWFFAPGNVEIVVKEIDACTYNGRRWIFLSGLTDVAVHVVVTDFETNQVKVYSNPQGHSFTPVLDSSAFATCP